MTLSFTVIFEILFNVAYLIIIWSIVGKMTSQYGRVSIGDKPVAKRLMVGYTLLALGDTGHVGFRVLAYAIGGLESKLSIAGTQIPIVGLGSVCTAYTVTILYMLIVDTWRVRFLKKVDALYILLQTVAVSRLIIMLFPQNEWTSAVTPFDWSMYRNMPLTFVGLVIAILLLIDANKDNDKTFRNFAYFIFASFFFYLPVILFYQIAPMVGMLMIPKTIAYLLMAYSTYKRFFKKAAASQMTLDM